MDIDKVIEVIRESKRCPIGYKWDKKRKECVPKKSSKWRVYAGWGRYRDEKEDDDGKKNGKKNDSNGNGHSNGGSGNGNGGNGNGGNGNGGSDGGGGE
tara:strand:+ start:87 stop:380 length:294 start_codon:yes stop_codon:yes gene_type:complete